MPKFYVTAQVIGSKRIGIFEAPTKEAAIELAEDSDEAWAQVCHQCSKEVNDPELGDFFAEEV